MTDNDFRGFYGPSESLARAREDGLAIIALQPSPQIAEAAREHDLGQLRQSFRAVQAGLDARTRKRIQAAVFEFDRGFVQQAPGSPPQTCRWDQIATVVQKVTAVYRDRKYVVTTFSYAFVRRDGVSVKMAGTYLDLDRGPDVSDEQHIMNDASSGRYRYAGFGADVARYALTAQLPAAQAALGRGEELTFGRFAISTRGLRTGRRDPLPWTRVSKVQVSDGTVRITRAGTVIPTLRHPIRKIPNFLLFMTLTRTLRDRAGKKPRA